MIAEFGQDETRPHIARFKGKVALYVPDPEDENSNHGFLLPDRAAFDTAVKMLAAVADLKGDDAFSHDVDSITFQVFRVLGREPEGLLTFRLAGAPFSATLNATQIAETAAAFTAASTYIDETRPPPRHDL